MSDLGECYRRSICTCLAFRTTLPVGLYNQSVDGCGNIAGMLAWTPKSEAGMNLPLACNSYQGNGGSRGPVKSAPAFERQPA